MRNEKIKGRNETLKGRNETLMFVLSLQISFTFVEQLMDFYLIMHGILLRKNDLDYLVIT